MSVKIVTDTVARQVVFGDKVLITDPCYPKGTRCTAEFDVKPGIWEFKYTIEPCGKWGKWVVDWVCYNKEESEKAVKVDKTNPWKFKPLATVGVDSGQLGIFDSAKYPNGAEFDSEFYKHISDGTLGDERCGSVDFGAATESGCGDGVYQVLGVKIAGVYVAFKVVFVSDSEVIKNRGGKNETGN